MQEEEGEEQDKAEGVGWERKEKCRRRPEREEVGRGDRVGGERHGNREALATKRQLIYNKAECTGDLIYASGS